MFWLSVCWLKSNGICFHQVLQGGQVVGCEKSFLLIVWFSVVSFFISFNGVSFGLGTKALVERMLGCFVMCASNIAV